MSAVSALVIAVCALMRAVCEPVTDVCALVIAVCALVIALVNHCHCLAMYRSLAVRLPRATLSHNGSCVSLAATLGL